VVEVHKVADGEQVSEIRKATEALSQLIQKIGAAVYDQPVVPSGEEGAAQGQAEKTTEASGEDDVLEGEVKE
jgi:hypothetical protein